jgi:hypothetical protein
VDSRIDLPAGAQTVTRYISVPSTDLRVAKGSDLQMGTQALFGQRFDLIRSKDGLAYGALYSVLRDRNRIDYIGLVPAISVSDGPLAPTHCVKALAAAVFERADIKSKLQGSLPRNAVAEGEVQGEFLSLDGRGYVHLKHLRRVGEASPRDFMNIAKDMLGLPYVWGGTGHVGVDCSGLVQSALAAAGVDAPRDTDQQEAGLGRSVSYGARQAGDLLFWPGHVGIVMTGDRLLHANAFHMCVEIEPIEKAVARIGAVRAVKRLS